MKKPITLFISVMLFSGMAQAAPVTLVEYGTESGTFSLAPLSSHTNITPQNLTAGNGLTSNMGSTFNFRGWDNTTSGVEEAGNNGDFWVFQFRALQEMSITTLDIRVDRSATGPTDFEIVVGTPNSFLGSPTSVLSGTPSTNGTTYLGADLSSISLSAGDFLSFGLSAWGASSLSGTFGLEAFDGDVALRVSGEVAAVPVPAAVWLFGSALIGLAGVRRKKK